MGEARLVMTPAEAMPPQPRMPGGTGCASPVLAERLPQSGRWVQLALRAERKELAPLPWCCQLLPLHRLQRPGAV